MRFRRITAFSPLYDFARARSGIPDAGKCEVCGKTFAREDFDKLELHEEPWYKEKYGRRERPESKTKNPVWRTVPFLKLVKTGEIDEDLWRGVKCVCANCHKLLHPRHP